MSAKEHVDISEPLRTLCDLLDLNYECVSELRLTPTDARATIYLRNADGAKHLDDSHRDPVMTVRKFAVRT